MRISFCGDDGCNEKMAVIPHYSESFEEVSVEEISADNSGRSFLLKLPGAQISYFWCSEKSNVVGVQLLQKMKSLLQRRPSLSQLTGVCESRLDSFATHLRAYLLVSTSSAETSDATILPTASCSRESALSSQSTSTTSKSSRSRQSAAQPGKVYPLYQGSLSPRSSTFKDGPSRSLSTLRNGVREKFKKHGESSSSLFISANLGVPTSLSDIHPSYNSRFNEDKLKEEDNNPGSCGLLELPSLTSSSSSYSPLPFHFPVPQLPVSSSPLLSPYYCWCPPCTSSFQHMATPSILPPVASDTLPLPPVSSLLSATGSVSFLPSEPPCEQSQLPNFELPSILPASSYVAMSSSQQIPTFTPFMSDPIVHVPFIDVCSSGPGYLVSAGPAISSAISPLLPNLVHPLTEAESLVEKNARETLRMLMASTPTNPQLMQVLPAVLTSTEERFPFNHARKHDMVVTGSRGLYSGVQDINDIANSICLMDFTSSSSRTTGTEDCGVRIENGQKKWEAERRVQKSEGEDAKDSES